jgi:hypothetical protein
MKHDELKARIAQKEFILITHGERTYNVEQLKSRNDKALLAVLDLHTPLKHCANPNCESFICIACNPVKMINDVMWPCPTVQAIERVIG